MSRKRSDCPISCSLEIWGDKWSLLIIRDLMLKKECTYGELQKADEKIASNILATRLQNLMENGIIDKRDHPDNKLKILYYLTEKGIDLVPIIVEINLWGDKYLTIPDDRKKLLEDIKKDKEDFIKRAKVYLSNKSQ
ncbi:MULTISPECIES: winged helix-turn-helix transcriptional regulator [Chryseobacterium]|uniref:Transcriptional regulator n=1 Tax=Chryseobacterium pennae TaxID=2258962 RepID=A0A3D9C0Y5_9FLAO|nr:MULTISPECIES: helix-turn-helix domain-containing protein [Chryseobacterium]MCS4301995.1 DNA-binding HxlR family transcriptional regulator [Chryseobacterium sp. BIGb0232]REC59196.1 transcriptional regulator [Chryseobacterium pennae]ROS17942.1 HxlR family transcriptional regulator [Chryseobacterium nakagawai]